MAATTSNDFSDGPVMSVINKRLRKKLNRIQHTEEALSQGKPINKEQEVLRSKPSVLSLFDELEKLRQPLSSALTEELNLALAPHHHHHNQTLEPANSSPTQPEPERNSNDAVPVLEDLLNLIYFGSLFDVKSRSDFASTMLTWTDERGCCLTYDYVTDDAADLLREKDLDLIAAMRRLLISRPADSSLWHKNALKRCIEHAKLWLAKAQQPIEPNADVTCNGLIQKLDTFC